jgi:hypothetical protein
MTASAQAALDAMAAAESVARNVIAVERLPFKSWARDRVRLIERDRDTLELHAATDYGDGQRLLRGLRRPLPMPRPCRGYRLLVPRRGDA